ncbi:MAG: KUP/HAK/KT family potassium transporter [Bacteroidetes bacterium]|jgi:KUP system potassium uptake protein|nr:KUP/HAK/KT family potassium transporter [Bacteroidota bacterium]
MASHNHSRITLGGLLISLGIIYGDIGTSPLYVMKAIVGDQRINQDLVLGGLSCVIWTLTLMTTVKYVIITLRADNKGEGGIFSLYALIRRQKRWLIFPAIIGGATLLADGIITPSISVSSAVEGLRILNPEINTIPIVLVILSLLFFVQQFGTAAIGKSFGPVMLVWFLVLFVLGLYSLLQTPEVLLAVNPVYAWNLLINYPGGFLLLGAVFLCTTGAEALYSDLGHAGRANIRLSWVLVKLCLLVNYLGQGAWLLRHSGQLLEGQNPFFQLMPAWFLPFGILLATLATIIASQALISGSFTLISEAVQLELWPKSKIIYPTEQKGQLYLPGINLLLWIGCLGIVLYFRESEHMEAAYGLAITITMLITTVLLGFYLAKRGTHAALLGPLMVLFLTVEGIFFVSNTHKFMDGGWVSLLIAIALVLVMLIWRRGRILKARYTDYVDLAGYLPMLQELSQDESVSKYSTHLIYLTSAPSNRKVEWKILYSIFRKQPKRADTYWFIHVDVTDDPHTREFEVETLVPGQVFRVNFTLGFRVQPRINLLYRKVVENMIASGEVDILSRYTSLRNHQQAGDFRFIVIDRFLSAENELPFFERIGMKSYFFLKHFTQGDEQSFGLDSSSATVEKVPFIITPPKDFSLKRIQRENTA